MDNQISGIYKKDVLKNGMRVVSEYIPHIHSIAVGFWIIGGSRIEDKSCSGISHFIEHMLFKGTKHRSALDIAIEIDSIGGNLDAFTSKEVTAILANVLDEHLPVAIDLLFDLLFCPRFPEEEIELEKSVILEEIRMIDDMPDEYIDDFYLKNLWPNHPLGRPITGDSKFIQNIDRSTMIDYYKANYKPSNIVLAAAGNLEHEKLIELVEKACTNFSFPQSQQKKIVVSNSPKFESHISVEQRDLEQVHLCIGTIGLPLCHKKRYAGFLLTTILGSSMSSRLFQSIREKRGLAYSIYSFMTNYLDIGNLTVYAGTKNENVPEVIDLTIKELKDIKNSLIEDKELTRGKNQLKGNLMLSLESSVNRMSRLAKQEIYFEKFFQLEDIVASIEKVNSEDILSLANDIIVKEYINLAILGPFDSCKLDKEMFYVL